MGWSFANPFLPRWYIRVAYGANEDWEDARGEVAQLAAKAFSKADEAVSVFRVSSEIEEARAIAACQINRGQTPRSPVLALRFTGADLKRVALRPEETLGTTGVVAVDKAHRNLRGGVDSYTQLATLVLQRQKEGRITVRRLMRNVMCFQFRTFLSNQHEELSPHARTRCEEFVAALGGL